MSGMSFGVRGKRMINVSKLVNTKHARLTVDVFKGDCKAGVSNRVFVGKGRIGLGAMRRTVSGGLTCIARSEGKGKLVLSGSVGVGASLTGVGNVDGKRIVSTSGRCTMTRRCEGGLGAGYPSIRRGMNGLDNNGRRGILLTG